MFVADEAWSKTDPQALKSAGYVGVIGYCSYDRTGKNLAPANIAAYHAAGLQVGLVWETYGQAASGGDSVGTKEAFDFVAQLRALGATGGTVYMVGEDPNSVGPGGWPNIDAYFAAAAPIVTGAGFRLGDYGSGARWPLGTGNLPSPPARLERRNVLVILVLVALNVVEIVGSPSSTVAD